MSAAVDCPEYAAWPGLLDDTLPADERSRYERHLEACPVCQDRLDRCDECADAWREFARQLGDPTVIPADPTLTQILDRVRDPLTLGPSPTRGEGRSKNPPLSPCGRGAEGEGADLYFLKPVGRPDLLGMLGDYEVQEVIGQGGMGVVLKAYEPALHRLVAIKVLAAAVAGSGTARRRFTREAQAAAAVCHENIVPVHGVHEIDGLPYLVMQYVAGESLQGRLDRTGPLEVTEIVRIALQTASGLAAAHAQGLIHRDIKPANLLLENGLARVKITDFGLARMADDAPLTQPGVVAGTPEYMAPEQARGEPVDHRADLFSLGSVIYAMCTGKPPFRGISAVAVLRQVSDYEPPAIRSLNPETPVWLETFVARLMAKDPGERIQSAGEVADLLEGYLAHLRQPATAPAPRLPKPAGLAPAAATARWGLAGLLRNSRTTLAGAVAAVILVTAGILLLISGGAQPAANFPAPFGLYQDFRKQQPLSGGFFLMGTDAEQFVERGGEGYHVRLPAGRRLPRLMKGVGVATKQPVAGDFQITAGYQFISSGPVSGADMAGVDLYYTRGPDGKRHGRIGRFNTAAGPVYEVRDSTYRPAPKNAVTVPTQAMKGELRLARQGRVLSYSVKDETTQGEFRELFQADFGIEPLTFVLFEVNPGNQATPVDVRLVDLRVQAGPAVANPPPAQVPSAEPPFDVWSVATSKDGKIVVAGGGHWEHPGEIGVWDRATRQPLQRFAEERGVASVALSPDGKWLASGCWDGHVRVRDWAAGKQIADFETNGVARVAFSPRGDILATATEGKSAQLWDVANGQLLADLDGDLFRFHCVAFSPDGRRVLAGGGDWKKGGLAQVNVWDVASKKQIQKLTGHENTILGVAVSHDGKTIATASVDQTIRLWDGDTGRWLKTLKGHTNWVESVAFSPDDKTLISGGHDCTVRTWDVARGEPILATRVPQLIRKVHLTPDGKTLFVGGSQKTLTVFDVADGPAYTQTALLWNGVAASPTAAVAMDNQPVADPSPGRGRGWLSTILIGGFTIGLFLAGWFIIRRNRESEDSDEQRPPGQAVVSRPTGISRSPTSQRESRRRRLTLAAILAVAGLAIGLIAFDFLGPHQAAQADDPAAGNHLLRGHTGPVHNVRFLPDGQLVSGSGWPNGDRTVRVWDVTAGGQKKLFSLPAQVHALDVSSDGRFALVGLGNGQVQYLDLQAVRVVRTMKGHAGEIGWVGFAPDAKHAFSASADGTARMWNLEDGREQQRFTVVNPRARGGAVFPDGKRLLTGDGGGVLQIWNIADGQELKRIERTGFIDSLAILADGKQALIAGGGGAHLFDLDAGRDVRSFQEDSEEVHQAALSPDGKQLLTAGFDGVIRLWDFESGKLIRSLGSHDGFAFSVAFSPDGRWAASAGDAHSNGGHVVPGTDHDIRLWDLSGPAETSTPRPWLPILGVVLLLAAAAGVAYLYAGRRRVASAPCPPATATADKIHCPGCGKAFTVKPEWAGKKAKCPCGHIVVMPAASLKSNQ